MSESSIPTVLCGMGHPHAHEWYDALGQVPELRPVAHYEPDAGRARTPLPAPYEGLPIYGDLGELLSRESVEAALLLLPTHQAETCMLALARAGVHIFADKPVSRTAAALQQVAEAQRPGAVFYTGYLWRLDPLIEQVHQLIRQGILGTLWSIEMRWVTSRIGSHEDAPLHRDPRSYLFRQGESRGGILQWLGCHFVDLMLYLVGEPVVSVSAMMARLTSDEIEVEDTATCLLRFAEGALGSVHAGYLLPTGGNQFIGLRGSLGWMHWDSNDGRRLTVHSRHGDWVGAPTRHYDFPRPLNTTYGGGGSVILLRDFARCIRAGGSQPLFTIDDALRVLYVLDAAYASAERGQTVAVSL